MLEALVIMTLIVGIFTGAVGMWTVAYLMDRQALQARHRAVTLDEAGQQAEDLCRADTPLAPSLLV